MAHSTSSPGQSGMGKTYLGLSTYPSRHPTHGGQRRVAAIRRHLATLGITYVPVAVYEPASYGADAVEKNDIALGYAASPFQGLPFIGDILAGTYAAQNETAYRHFTRLIADLKPACLVLEHPFMWPLVERLRADPAIPPLPLIYSSHNVEAPLKADILRKAGVAEPLVASVQQYIQALEAKVCAAAALIVAVSAHDARQYAALAPAGPVVVARNGIERQPASATPRRDIFDNRRTFFFVGSAYPPNIEGFCELVLPGGLFFLPPEKHMAICGGASDGIYADPRYHGVVAAHSERVHFFPKIDDAALAEIKAAAHAALLPITYGGGTNLKTAEAISMNCHIVATRTAMRGFEEFMPLTGLHIADDAQGFRRAMVEVFHAPPLIVPAEERARRDAVHWERCFDALTAAVLPA